MESVFVNPIKEVGSGRYEASFTASRCGYYMISIIVDGHHIPGSPYRLRIVSNDFELLAIRTYVFRSMVVYII